MYHWNYLDHLPLLAVFLFTTGLIVAAAEVGLLLGQRAAARLPEGEQPHVGPAVAATLGLLAFVLAFTFGAGADRLQAKRALLLDETNAIGTVLLRADLLPEPHRNQAQAILGEYVDLLLDTAARGRLEMFASSTEEASLRVVAGAAEAKRLHALLWQQAIQVARENPTPTNSLYLGALNDMFDLLQKRLTTAMQYRMPEVFWFVLYCLAALAMGLAGYESGLVRSRRNNAMWAVALAFASVMTLVIAMDRPQNSAIRQLPMLDLQADIRAARGAT